MFKQLSSNRFFSAVVSSMAIASCFVCTAAQAAPAISAVAGTVGNGNQVTVTGSGFGSAGPNIALFDDFEKGTNGSALSTSAGSAQIGQWSPRAEGCWGCSGTIVNTTYSTAQAHSGTKAVRLDFASQSVGADVLFADASAVYFSYWVLVPTGSVVPGVNNADGPNWKHVMVSGSPWPEADYTSVFVQDLPYPQLSDMGGWYDGNNSIGTWRSTSILKGRWHRYEWYLRGSSASTGIMQGWELNVGTPRTSRQNDQNVTNFKSGQAWNLVRMNAYSRLDAGANNYFDDFYVATGSAARARVEIGNEPTYDACTNLAVSTATAWSDTAVQATIRQGSFQSGAGAYLYVIDANGNVNSQGYPITIGQSSSGGIPVPGNLCITSPQTGLCIQ